jgi:tRNA pseudouridine55 synthase
VPDVPVSGFLNVCKGAGESSHAVVARVRRAIGVRRVGHAGTLDPQAVGVLPIAIGHATRFTMASGWGMKSYWADVAFGASTTTDDATGAVIDRGDSGVVTREALLAALPGFTGKALQVPPIYSAVHVAGQRSYRRARQGERTPPQAREAQIDAIRLVAWSPPRAAIVVQCHSGTYIRSLARDLGMSLGCPAHLAALIRLRVGPFRIEESIGLNAFEERATTADWQSSVWPMDAALEDVDALFLDRDRELDFIHGRRWLISGNDLPPMSSSEKGLNGDTAAIRVRVYARSGEFLGLAQQTEGQWQPSVVVAESLG